MGDPVTGALYFIFTSEFVSAVVIRTILINVLLGGFEFEEDGVVWRAIN